MPKFIKGFLPGFGSDARRDRLLALPPGKYRIIDGVFKRLNVSQEKTLINLPDYGNTSAASPMITLHEAIESGRIKDGDKVCFVAFGAGMTRGPAVPGIEADKMFDRVTQLLKIKYPVIQGGMAWVADADLCSCREQCRRLPGSSRLRACPLNPGRADRQNKEN